MHLNFTRAIGFFNTPITVIASEIANKAKNLSEAIDILRKNRPTSGWTFVIADAKAKEAAIVETCAEGIAISHPENCVLCYTNCYTSEIQKNREYAPSYTWVENNHSRYTRLKNLLLEHLGSIEENTLAEILGDTFDPTVRKNVALGHTVSNAANVSSAMICYEKDALWVGDNPVPANRGVYVGYKISSLLSGKKEEIGTIKGKQLEKHKEEALRKFTEACFVWEETASPSKCLPYITKAIEMDPEEPLYRLVRSWFFAKTGRFKEALDDLLHIEDSHLSSSRKAQIYLWIARINDLLNERENALRYYHKAIQTHPSMDIQKAAWEGIRKKYKRSMIEKLDILPFVAEHLDI